MHFVGWVLVIICIYMPRNHIGHRILIWHDFSCPGISGKTRENLTYPCSTYIHIHLLLSPNNIFLHLKSRNLSHFQLLYDLNIWEFKCHRISCLCYTFLLSYLQVRMCITYFIASDFSRNRESTPEKLIHRYVVQAFVELLQAPQKHANTIIKKRFPVPRLVICDQHGSQVTLPN